jgi:hypothetical protein
VWSVLSVLLLLLVPMVIWARSRGAERGG